MASSIWEKSRGSSNLPVSITTSRKGFGMDDKKIESLLRLRAELRAETQFTCSECKHTLPMSYMGTEPGKCYLCIPLSEEEEKILEDYQCHFTNMLVTPVEKELKLSVKCRKDSTTASVATVNQKKLC